MVEALPRNPYSSPDGPEWHAAYERCLELERMSSWATHIPDLDKVSGEALMLQTSPEVAGRTLGYALIEAHTDRSRSCVACEINKCGRDFEALAGLAHLYIFGFTRIFRNPFGPTPTASTAETPLDSLDAAVEDQVGMTPEDLKDRLALRESNRCAFTNRIDLKAPPEILDATAGEDVLLAALQVAHIISQSLTQGIGGLTARAREKLDWAVSPATVFDRFSGERIHDILGVDLDLHNPVNAMLTEYTAHSVFNRLGIWLIPARDEQGQTIPSTYEVGGRKPSLHPRLGIRSRIAFRPYERDGVQVLPPSPVLLAMHAACARVAHQSGAADLLDALDEDTEHMMGLSGSSVDPSFNATGAAELVRALHRIQVVGQA